MTERGGVVWFTGLPASGKTTLARRLRDRLAPRTSCVLLDSDELRDTFDDHAYAPADRDAFYQLLGRLAAVLARQGHIVLVAATAPRRLHRDHARAAAPRFLEVHVRAPLEACEARDVKGLYAAARAGEAKDLPGVGAPYESPLAPDVIAEGGNDEAAAVELERRITRTWDAGATTGSPG